MSSPNTPAAHAVVVMGVAGCGKSTIAGLLAERIGWPAIEGDEFHPPANQAKMRAGIALTDADRAGWLAALAEQLRSHPGPVVLSCSALKRDYRERLRQAAPGLRFVFLDIDQALAHRRVAARAGSHLFPPSLVASQFATLEDPRGEDGVLRLDAALPPEVLAERAAGWILEGRSA